ncbi:EF-hand calcium-binding domain-containing protein 14 isoform X3 [Cynoglossus semilaevis]|uniref:EF-hand calcium-binding domain-containing protein 14 isoform X3 n=1 Tax=Cynoglossus semilaevis TaxID=244447 RepID=UPI000D62D8A3|nr:EF-hand calcium-binding domain-containing protein 14 isoform X3 [Cynoglossus semilaevis]
MKKRKELNALIGLGDSKRKKTKKGTGHRLLRTEPPGSESESSSDEDEFNSLNGGSNFGKNYTRCCNVCYPLFLFIVLAACVMACAGLVWMQTALKEDLDSLKEKLRSMESSQKVSSSEIPKLSEDLKNRDRKLDDIENGERGLNKLWSNLTEINKKISLLDSAVNQLKTNLKSAADLISLPTTVEELQKSVATIGSTLTSVQHDVNTMQSALENKEKEDGSEQTMEVTDLNKAVSEVNKTEEQHHSWTAEQIQVLLSTVADLRKRVETLENGPKLADNETAAQERDKGKNVAAQTGKDASMTNGTAGDEQEDAPQLQLRRRPRFLSTNRSKRHIKKSCPKSVSLPGVHFLKDLEELFRQTGIGHSSPGITYSVLRNVLGTSSPGAHTLDCFDSDGNQRYSLTELRAAAGL